MSELGYHIGLSLTDGRVIATSAAELRAVARAVLAPGRDYQLLTMRAADSHLHLTAACSRPDAGQFANRIENSLHRRLELPVGFAPPHFEPIRDQRHLYAASRYALRQDERHGIDLDPYAEASNLPDLLGLRLLGAYTATNVARFLPGLRAEELAERLAVTLDQLRYGAIPSEKLELLSDAAAAAVALSNLHGNRADAVAARRAAIALVGHACSATRLATVLDTSARTVRRQRQQSADPQLVEAVGRQLRLRSAAARPPLGAALTLPPAA